MTFSSGKEFRELEPLTTEITDEFANHIVLVQDPNPPYKTFQMPVSEFKKYTSLNIAGEQYYPPSPEQPIATVDKVNWIWPQTDANGKVLGLYIPDFATGFWVSKLLYTYTGYNHALADSQNNLVAPYIDNTYALMIERICCSVRLEAGLFPINAGWKADFSHKTHGSSVFNGDFLVNFFDSIGWIQNQTEAVTKTDPTYVNYWVTDVHQILDATGGFPLTEIIYTKDGAVPNLSASYTIHYRLVQDRFR